MSTAKYKMHILVCGGTGCKSADSSHIVENLNAELESHGIEDEAKVVMTGCFGFCEQGPIVKVIPDNTFYTKVKPEDAKEIIEEHVIKGRSVKRLLYVDPKNEVHVSDSKQMGIALRNCGFLDPENIEESIARDAYQALGKVLAEMTPQQCIDLMKKSGLRV